MEAEKQLDAAIKQQPKKARMDKNTAIKLMREIILGEKNDPLPPNSVQHRKAKQAMQARSPGKIQVPLPTISASGRRAAQKEMAGNNEDVHTQRQQQPVHVATSPPDRADDDNKRLPRPVYVSDDKEEDEDNVAHNHRTRRRKQVQQNLQFAQTR